MGLPTAHLVLASILVCTSNAENGRAFGTDGVYALESGHRSRALVLIRHDNSARAANEGVTDRHGDRWSNNRKMDLNGMDRIVGACKEKDPKCVKSKQESNGGACGRLIDSGLGMERV